MENMLTPLEIVLSIFMTGASIFTAFNFYLLFAQRKREIKIHTAANVDKISESVTNFWLASKDIKEYTPETKQWYTEVVEPYLSFLLWLAIQIEYKLFDIKIVKKFNPQLEINYQRIKPYIKYNQKFDPKAWIEVEQLMKKLSIPL